MPDVTRIPLKRSLFGQRSYLVLDSDGITVDLRTWGSVFRTPWRVPQDQVTVARAKVSPELALPAPDRVWCRAPEVPLLENGASFGVRLTGNLTLLFTTPQRVAPVRRWRLRIWNDAWRTRYGAGFYVDGIALSAADPARACEVLEESAYPVTEDPVSWLREHHPSTNDPAVVEADRIASQWRKWIHLAQGALLVVAWIALHIVDDSLLGFALVIIAIGAIGGGGRMLTDFIERREGRVRGVRPAE